MKTYSSLTCCSQKRGLWPAPRWRAAERVRGKVGAMGIAANRWLREQNLELLLCEAASPVSSYAHSTYRPNWKMRYPTTGDLNRSMARTWPWRWLMWFTYCRCLRNQMKCHFLQIELNNLFAHASASHLLLLVLSNPCSFSSPGADPCQFCR